MTAATRVLFRQGGSRQWRWRATLIVGPYKAARAAAERIQKQGYKALIVGEAEFQRKGVPDTYNADEYFPRAYYQPRWVKP